MGVDLPLRAIQGLRELEDLADVVFLPDWRGTAGRDRAGPFRGPTLQPLERRASLAVVATEGGGRF